MKRLREWVVFVLVGITLSGCTGYGMDTQAKQWQLHDIYTGATGTMVHWQIGAYMVMLLEAEGAQQAGINLKIPRLG